MCGHTLTCRDTTQMNLQTHHTTHTYTYAYVHTIVTRHYKKVLCISPSYKNDMPVGWLNITIFDTCTQNHERKKKELTECRQQIAN
jgi:hypothetical protein